jgi:hypothetical protein
MKRTQLVELALGRHARLVRFRIRRAGYHGADLEDITSGVYEVLLTLDTEPVEADARKVINYAISRSISTWKFATARNGVVTDGLEIAS